MGSLLDSIKHLRKKLHHFFYSLFWEIESEGKLPTQSEASITPTSTQEKGIKRKKKIPQTNCSHKYKCKTP